MGTPTKEPTIVNIAKLAEKAKAAVDKNGDKIAAGIGKATDFVDKKTKGKHHDTLEKIDGLAAKLDKTRDDGTPDGQPPTP
ncbi:MAG: antitoxin [Acidimicrobiales bacterium]